MFSVIFEVHPKSDRWEEYLGYGKMLRPELERIDGFIDNVRFRSLTRDGWILSLSGWRDEKALVRWRTTATHHGVQEKGRDAIFLDYRLRVGQITADSAVPTGHQITEQRLDETEIGQGKAVTLIDGTREADWAANAGADAVAGWLGLKRNATGLLAWDVFDAVLTPGVITLVLSWQNDGDAAGFETSLAPKEGIRVRRVRVIRDYGMYDRREAPQYYPDADQNGHN